MFGVLGCKLVAQIRHTILYADQAKNTSLHYVIYCPLSRGEGAIVLSKNQVEVLKCTQTSQRE